ncbi:DEAD/DEAH box helicase [Staphylococcus debuckii]|uniref:DEAD/DEAH box helicase n=1 Tax=Staphylococcus debuckii TaxID=2044912 RepID=UPI001F0BEDE9|nr:DEAD/DEAH box helicase [Staphylococcus debuckii]
MNDNDQLILEGNSQEIKKLLRYSSFKMKIKMYVENILEDLIEFKKDIYYRDINKVIETLEKFQSKKGIELQVEPTVYEYIENENTYIELKYSIGNDIKNQDPRMIEKYLEFCEIVNNSMKRELRHKQMIDAFYLSMMEKAGNFSVPGSGKTSTVYGLYSYLNKTKDVDTILMIGPLNSFNSWIEEYKACFGGEQKLNYLNLKDYNTSTEKKMILTYESGNKELILVNYEILDNLEDEIKGIINKNVLVVFDEVHRIKSTTGKRAGAALRITENAKYMVALTGTPIPNGYIDIYNLLNLLYPNDYKKFFGFTETLLKNPDTNEMKMINDKIQPFFTRTTKEELNVPKQNKDIIIDVYADENEQELFKILLSKYKNSALALFAKISQMESVPKMLLEELDLNDFSKILDIAVSHEDFVDYKDFSEDVNYLVEKIKMTSKMRAALELVDRLTRENKTVILWCIFVKTMDKFKKLLSNMGIKAEIIAGRVEPYERKRIIDKFKNKEIDVLITNPHTLAESVSLHQTCHDAIYFEYSYNLVHLLQSKDRIHRLGLKENDYTQYYYLQQFYPMQQGDYSLGERVYNRLSDKEQLMLDAIDNHELEILPTEDEDLKFFFENVI